MNSHQNGPRRWLVWVLAAVALWLLAACNAPIFQGAAPTPASVADQPAATATATTPAQTSQEAATAAPEQPRYKGIPVGFTDTGSPYRGNPDAPITVYEYSDYQCPFCARHVTQTEPALDESYVRTGQARFVFRDFPLVQLHPNANAAALAALCVGDQGIVPYWEMHDKLFRTQDQWASLSDPSEFFAGLAEETGIDPAGYNACLSEKREEKQAHIDASLEAGRAIGFNGTPSFQFVREASGESFTLVGAQPYDVFQEWMQTLAAGGTPVDPAEAQRQQQDQAQTQQMPFWATAEGLAPDPDNPGYTVAGDEYKGNPDAPLTVVEFSDFQCPYCRNHVLNTQPTLDEQFVDPGDVFWVFKHFPIQNIHPNAMVASIAAECAGRQGRFWEMHDKLFSSQDQWANGDTEAVFTQLGEELGLDTEAYAACRADQQTEEAIKNDLADGSPFVRGTPTFAVLYGGQGRLIPGALPVDQFTNALEQMLQEATASDQ